MQPFKLLLLILATAGFTACGSDDDEEFIPNKPELATISLPLTIDVRENPMLNPDESPSYAPTRRAPIITTSTLMAFNINYAYGSRPYTGSTSATKTSEGKWTSTGTWPVGGSTKVNWYATSGGTFQNASDPYVNFTVEESATSQKDLLVAETTASYADAGGSIAFTFDHVCTALRFYVKKAENLADYNLSITNVKLCNVVNTGKYYFNTSSWTLGSTRASYTLYEGTAKELSTSRDEYLLLNTSTDQEAPYLFMIPQTLTAWDGITAISSATAQTYLQIACIIKKDGANIFDGTAYIPFAATSLAAGYQHDVRINIGKNSLYSSANTKVIL